jgi:single-strand DNA-binding protein
MGNLTRDPDFKQLQSGQSVCRLGLASNRQFKNRQTGAMVQEVCFVDIDVWGPQAESCNQYLQKGRGVLVEGRLKLDSWVDNDGNRRSKHSVVADRVTFMPAQASQDTNFDYGQSEPVKQENPEPQAVPAQEAKPAPAQQVSPAQEAKPAAKPETTENGEVNFKDQAPFEDDLPF